MFLQDKRTGVLVKIVDATALINPLEDKIYTRGQSGEEEQEPEKIAKSQLIFPSGEELPRCWVDSTYREAM